MCVAGAYPSQIDRLVTFAPHAPEREIGGNRKKNITHKKKNMLTENETPQRSVMRNSSNAITRSLKTSSIWSVPHPRKSSTWMEVTLDQRAAIWRRWFNKVDFIKTFKAQ